jgi:hypothetical protein
MDVNYKFVVRLCGYVYVRGLGGLEGDVADRLWAEARLMSIAFGKVGCEAAQPVFCEHQAAEKVGSPLKH